MTSQLRRLVSNHAFTFSPFDTVFSIQTYNFSSISPIYFPSWHTSPLLCLANASPLAPPSSLSSPQLGFFTSIITFKRFGQKVLHYPCQMLFAIHPRPKHPCRGLHTSVEAFAGQQISAEPSHKLHNGIHQRTIKRYQRQYPDPLQTVIHAPCTSSLPLYNSSLPNQPPTSTFPPLSTSLSPQRPFQYLAVLGPVRERHGVVGQMGLLLLVVMEG